MGTNYDESYKVTNSLLNNIKYMYDTQVIQILQLLVYSYSLPLTQDVIDGMKDALIDYFFDGFDPDWDSFGMWQWWEGLCPEWFEKTSYATLRPLKLPSDFSDL